MKRRFAATGHFVALRRVVATVVIVSASATGCAPSLPWRDRGADATADSLEAVLRESGDDRIEISEPPPPADNRGASSLRPHVDATGVFGHRRLTDIRAGIGSYAGARLRTVDGQSAGHVALGRRDGHFHAMAGRLGLRAGERVLVGSVFGTLPPARSGGTARGFEVRPTGSLWYGAEGLALSVAAKGWRCTGVSVSSDRGLLLRGFATNWISLVREGRMSVGAAAARDSDDRHAATVFAHVTRHDLFASGEVSWIGEQLFGHLRVTTAGGRVSARVFHVPHFSAATRAAVVLAPPGKTTRGAAIAARGGWRRLRLSGAVIAGERRDGFDRRRMQRALLEAGTRWARRFACTGYLALIADDEEEAATDPLIEQPPLDTERRVVTRIELRVDERTNISHRLRVEYSRRPDGARGVAVTAGSRLRHGRLGLEWRVSGYSVDSGLRSYVSRPGIGTFEYVSTVYGEGSDAAIRLRIDLAAGARLEAVAVSTWRKPARLYVALRTLL